VPNLRARVILSPSGEGALGLVLMREKAGLPLLLEVESGEIPTSEKLPVLSRGTWIDRGDSSLWRNGELTFLCKGGCSAVLPASTTVVSREGKKVTKPISTTLLLSALASGEFVLGLAYILVALGDYSFFVSFSSIFLLLN